MTESDFRAEQFQKYLPKRAGKRVFLYGAGPDAKLTLERCGSFPFLGVIAREEEIPEKREEFAAFGKELLSLEEALRRRPDVIVIAARMRSVEAVYQRIAGRCREQGVGIVDLYGFDQLALHEELESQTWLDLAGWRKRTAGYDVLSFELLDTLIERDLFHSREGHVRPVFARLLRDPAPEDRIILYIASPEYPEEWYRRILEREGLWGENTRFFFNDWKQEFFRNLKAAYPGKRCLHIGHSLLENGIIPRICGFDACRMIYFDIGQLTAFLKEPEEKSAAAGADRAALITAIEGAKAVSFDIFDTLLMRETADFRDVFELAACRAAAEGVLRDAEEKALFLAARGAAQSGEITLDELYRRVGDVLRLPEGRLRRLEELELQTEERILVPRREVAAMIGEARRLGKQVVLTSDMYLDEEQLERLLHAKGITGYGRIFVSSRYGLCKRDGLLALLPQELGLAPGDILHIGDSRGNDELPAEQAGIRFFRIPPARWTEEPEKAAEREGLAERLFRGLWQSRRFSDPFAEEKPDREAALYRYGYTAAAPLLAGWLVWFFAGLLQKRPGKILFASRDGWLLRELYESMRGECFPESVYYYSSRHAAFLLSADRPETAGFMAEMAGDMSPGRLLRQFFDLEEEPDAEQTQKDPLYEVIRRNSARIRRRAEEARRNYARYRESCGLTGTADLCYVDFVAAGTAQRMLEEASGTAAEGVYFGRPLTAGAAPCSIRAYISGESGPERKFLARYLELEYYMTSPEPSLRAFDEAGRPLFMEEIRTEKELEEIGIVHQAVRDFFGEWLELSGWRQLTEELFSGRPEARRHLEELSRGLPAEKVCRMYLASVSRDAGQRYFDDWSGKWIETEKPA